MSNNIKTITFGQPAVGKWSFLEEYQTKLKNYTRVVNIGQADKVINKVSMATIGDPVAISTNVINMHHFGNMRIISENESIDISNFLPYLVSLHKITTYQKYFDRIS